MRNKFRGFCYRCNQQVLPGEGHFEHIPTGWRMQHAECAIAYRHTKLAGARPASMFDAKEINRRILEGCEP